MVNIKNKSSYKKVIVMIYLRYEWDHIKTEDYTNLPSERAKSLPVFLRSMGNWEEGVKYYTKRQNKDDFYILYTVSGTGLISYRNKQTYVNKGEICIIDCIEEHTYMTYSCDKWHTVWFHIFGDALPCFFNLINPEDSFNAIPIEDEHVPLKVFSELIPLVNSQDIYDEINIEYILIGLLNYILVQHYINSKTDRTEEIPLLTRVKDYIESNIHSVITLTQVSNDLSVPLQQIENCFSYYEHIKVEDYIRQRYEIHKSNNYTGIKNSHPEWLIDSIKYINMNFTKNIKFKDIIENCYVSKSVYIEKFKQFTCMHPMNYLINLRLKNALNLLDNTDLKINDIASESGFSSASNFAMHFKTWTGLTPSDYKENKGNRI